MFIKRTLTLFALAAGLASSAMANPLSFSYVITDSGVPAPDRYMYSFHLSLLNLDSSWSSGQTWADIIVADASPPDIFSFDLVRQDFAPFSGLVPYITPSHRGYRLVGSADNAWTPTAVGEVLSWSGTSSIFNDQLSFSALYAYNGASSFEFDAATGVLVRVPVGPGGDGPLPPFPPGPGITPVPEPSTYGLMGAGALGAFAFIRRRRAAKKAV